MYSSLEAIVSAVNLLRCNGAKIAKMDGKVGVFIPVDDNPFIRFNRKGDALYMNLLMRPFNDDYGHTYAVMGHLRGMDVSSLSKDDLKALAPVIGYAMPAISDNAANPAGEGITDIKEETNIPL